MNIVCTKDTEVHTSDSNRTNEKDTIITGKWLFKSYRLVNENGFPVGDTVKVNDTLSFYQQDHYRYLYKNGDSSKNEYTIYRLYGNRLEYYYFEMVLPNLGRVKTDELSIYFEDKIDELFTTDTDKRYNIILLKQ